MLGTILLALVIGAVIGALPLLIAVILLLATDRITDCDVGPIAGSNSQIIGGQQLKALRDKMRAQGTDVLTPVLVAAFFGTLVLILISGDQTGDMLALLGKPWGLW
jgi:hypothetical protein